jgi:hypothetical protein
MLMMVQWMILIPRVDWYLFKGWVERHNYSCVEKFPIIGEAMYLVDVNIDLQREEEEGNAERVRKDAGFDQGEPEEKRDVGRKSGQGSEEDRCRYMEQASQKRPCDEQTSQEEIIHPPHYASKDIECIDYIHAQLSPEEFKGYLRGNAIKYLSRFGVKDSTTKDAAKAIVYLGWLFAHEAGEIEGEMPSMIVDRLDIAKILAEDDNQPTTIIDDLDYKIDLQSLKKTVDEYKTKYPDEKE